MVEQKVSPFLDENNLIKIEQIGDYIDTNYDSNFGFDPWEGKYNANYFLNPNSYCIEKIELECVINYDSPIKATVNIAELKVKEVVKTKDQNETV